MVERRGGTSTGSDTVHSFGEDNIVRGDPDADFVKRRPTYPLGDDPRGREIDFESEDMGEAYGSRNPVYRAYRGQAPLEGQDFGAPERRGKLQKVSDLRPELPNRTVDYEALDRAKEEERAILRATDFAALYPNISISSPAPGATFSPGQELNVFAVVTSLRNIISATFYIDGQAVDRHVVPKADQDAKTEHTFRFVYTIPPNRNLGPMDITVRGFNINNSAQGIIADDAQNLPPRGQAMDLAVGTLDGRLGQSKGSQAIAPMLEQTFLLRSPQAVSSITVQII